MASEQIELLIVEDNPHDLELTLRAFERAKVVNHIEVARDGQEALDYLFGCVGSGRAYPRVVLLDLKLPKVDGLQVLREIRRDHALKTLPVVVLTSSREDRDIVESYDLGVNSYIVKPVNFEKFVSSVDTLGLYWLLLNERPIASRDAGREPALPR